MQAFVLLISDVCAHFYEPCLFVVTIQLGVKTQKNPENDNYFLHKC